MTVPNAPIDASTAGATTGSGAEPTVPSAAGDAGVIVNEAGPANTDPCAPKEVDWTAPPPQVAGAKWMPSTVEDYRCPPGDVRVHVRDMWSAGASPSLHTLPAAPVAISLIDVKANYIEHWARQDSPNCAWYSACLPREATSLQLKAVGGAEGCTQTSPSGTFDLAPVLGSASDVYLEYRGNAANLARDYALGVVPIGQQAFAASTDPGTITGRCAPYQTDAGAMIGPPPSSEFVTVHFRWPWGDPTDTGFAGTNCEQSKLGQATPPYPTSVRVLSEGVCSNLQAMLDFQDSHCPWYTVQIPRSAWGGAPPLSIQFAPADWRVQLNSATIDLPAQPPSELWIAYGGPPDNAPASGTACQDYSMRSSAYHVYLQNPGPGYPRCGSAAATTTIDPCAPPAPAGYSTVHFRYLWAGQKTFTLFPRADAMPKWLLLQVNGNDVTCTREADRPWFNCAVPNSEFHEGAVFRAVDKTRQPEEWTTVQERPFATTPGEYWLKWEYGRPDSNSGVFAWYAYNPDTANGDWSATGNWNDEACARKPIAATTSVGYGAKAWFPYSRTDYSYPFGASLARVYPNAPKVQEILNAFVFQRYALWKSNHIASGDAACGPDTARVKSDTASTTFSEGQGYGLAITAAIGDKDTFGRLWNFVRHYLSQSAKKYCGGLMGYKWDSPSDCRALDQPCDPEGDQCGSDQDSAFDGDVDIAIGLVFAARQWPEYAEAAINWLLKMECEVNTVYDGKRNIPAPGDTWDKSCPNYPAQSCQYQPGYAGTVNLSYYPPGYFRAFGDFLAAHLDPDTYTAETREQHRAFWNKTAQTVYDMYERCYDNKTVDPGLATDWGTYTSPCDRNTDNYNWARAMWRVSVDAAWFGNRLDLPENQPGSSGHYAGKTKMQAKIDNIQTYFNDFFKKNPPEPNANRFSTICRLLVPSGTAAGCNPSYDHNSYFVNTALSAYASVFDAGGRTTADIRRDAIEEAISTTVGNDRYYQESIGVYTMLFLSGNFPNPMDVP